MAREITADDISVIIPVYNRADKLHETLDCIYQQTQLPGEIVIVDDGSDDDPAPVIARYDERIKYHRQENSGPGGARNTAMNLATRKLVAFLDSDDEWLPTKLEKQISRWNELVRAGKDVVMMDTYIASLQNGRVSWYRKITKNGSCFKDLLRENVINGTSSVLCDRLTVTENGGFPIDYRFAEDRFVWLVLAKKGGCYTVPEVLVNKNHDGDNLTDNFEKNLFHKQKFIQHVASHFEVSDYSIKKMSAWNLAEFLMSYWRRGNLVKASEIAKMITSGGYVPHLIKHPKALFALFSVYLRTLGNTARS